MGIKVSKYIPTSSTSSNTTTLIDIPAEESFEDILVLNQAALKAMTIDAMVKESATGSINPDSVDAAAIMSFRSTLGANIKAPIPEDDWDGGTPQQVPVAQTVPVAETVESTTTPTVTNPVDDVTTADTEQTSNVSDCVANSGVLACSDELNSYFLKAAETYNVDVNLLKCIAYAESNFNPTSTSGSGAMGVMQLMPSTAEGLGVTDAYDAEQNIMGGAKYISIQLERFDGDIELALAAYNAGPGNVKKYGGIPPFEETQNYVTKIMNIYNNL